MIEHFILQVYKNDIKENIKLKTKDIKLGLNPPTADKIGFVLALNWVKLGLFWVKLGLNWVCFFVKSAFSGEKRIKLGLFVKIKCIWKYSIIEDRIQNTGDRSQRTGCKAYWVFHITDFISFTKGRIKFHNVPRQKVKLANIEGEPAAAGKLRGQKNTCLYN